MCEDCGTGCIEEKHLIECPKCGAKYHYGLIHLCSTGANKK